MHADDESTRRAFLHAATVATAGTVFTACAVTRGSARALSATPGAEEDVSAAEDLMREHGVLTRVLLIYREVIRRLDATHAAPTEALASAAGVIRTFIEDYHERLEEEFLFPRFRRANVHADLVEVLAVQHQAGRRLTDDITRLATASALRAPAHRGTLRERLSAFIRMYEPHEDTVLFPAVP